MMLLLSRILWSGNTARSSANTPDNCRTQTQMQIISPACTRTMAPDVPAVGGTGDCSADWNLGGVPPSDWMPQGAIMVLLSLHVLMFGFTEACHHSLSYL